MDGSQAPMYSRSLVCAAPALPSALMYDGCTRKASLIASGSVTVFCWAASGAVAPSVRTSRVLARMGGRRIVCTIGLGIAVLTSATSAVRTGIHLLVLEPPFRRQEGRNPGTDLTKKRIPRGV